jgi:hypothetical protein
MFCLLKASSTLDYQTSKASVRIGIILHVKFTFFFYILESLTVVKGDFFFLLSLGLSKALRSKLVKSRLHGRISFLYMVRADARLEGWNGMGFTRSVGLQLYLISRVSGAVGSHGALYV